MHFDARVAKLLKPADHIIVDDPPGLRLVASATRRTWTYRYKSPVDGRMRQVALGQWPAMSIAAATAAWDEARQRRDAGEDLASVKRADRKVRDQPVAREYTVRALCDDYLAGHVKVHRKPKGYAEGKRVFDRLLGPVENLAPAAVTRGVAFEFLEGLARTPVTAATMRAELGRRVRICAQCRAP